MTLEPTELPGQDKKGLVSDQDIFFWGEGKGMDFYHVDPLFVLGVAAGGRGTTDSLLDANQKIPD